MDFKADDKRFRPVNNTYMRSERGERSSEQIKGRIESGRYRIDLEMIAVTLARLLKERNRTSGR